ncbi:MAG TPA: phosphate ABC transporter permease subunit PstC [Acidimicrobiales bacterium]|nr:phosphate ABC transporter permease subunit PstC [Acidimicrobiales bacterium]
MAVEQHPLSAARTRGRLADEAFRLVALAAGLMILVILVLIAVTTISNAWPAFRQAGLSFFTSKEWVPNQGKFGALSFIFGTAVVATIAVVIALPISIGIALFVTEVAPARLRVLVVSVMDLLAGIPSVVFGLWGILVLAPNIAGLYNSVSRAVNPIPVLTTLFNGTQTGRSFFTAGLILAVMITPIITSVTREVFATVPRNDKDGALALGATRWEMIKGVVFPHSIGGMVGATMLGLGRAMGETIAVALVVGSVPNITANLFSTGDTMPSVIAFQFGEATGDHRSALIALGVALFALTIVVNTAARTIVRRVDTRMRGAL